MATKEQNGLEVKRSEGVLASALDHTWCYRVQLRLNVRTRLKRRSSQPASRAVVLTGPTILSFLAMHHGSYLRSIAECTIERMHQCIRTHGLRSNATL
jgi:hypothetical protein